MEHRFSFVIVAIALLIYVKQVEPADTRVYFLHITSDISYRFATTTVRSQIANSRTVASEISFNVQLPKAAFISNFSMEIDGVVYPGEVKEKEQARQQYERAKQRGQSAGHVAASPRNTNKFNVAVNVAAQSKVTFELLYQELLERRLGTYEHVININPGQVVQDMQITVNIHESREITLLKVPPIRKEISNEIQEKDAENELAVIHRAFPNRATVTYAPTEAQQRNASDLGVAGQFIVQYDVARARDGGDIQVVDGYFVHFIAPKDVRVGDKAILFILDVSGSMSGRKISQVHEAMNVILDELRPGDYFNMLKFSSGTEFWKDEMASATDAMKRRGKNWAQQLRATGSTNINRAVTEGIRNVADNVYRLSQTRQTPLSPLIIFLTDGLPSEGEQNLDKIIDNVKRTNEDRVTLFALGFGNDVDFPFLKKMALQNKGFARKIYADSDAAIQLQGFYQEVASPVLSDVTVEYLNNAADNQTLTQHKFHTYFEGTEMVVAGSLNDDVFSNVLAIKVSGNSAEGPLVFNMQARVDDRTDVEAPSAAGLQGNIERMWAYLTIKEILEKRLESADKDEKERLKQRALEMSLRYNFVTPVTSMVVTKPDEPPVSEELREEDGPTTGERGSHSPGIPAGGPAGLPGLPAPPPPRVYSAPPGRRQRRPSSRGFVDNDPHFVVGVDGSSQPLCFDVMGKIGNIFQLLHDPVLNITVNGLVIGKVNHNVRKQKTYLGQIGISVAGTTAVITPDSISVNNQERRWKKAGSTFRVGPLSFSFESKHFLRVSCRQNVSFAVIRHLIKNPNKVDFMGIYIEEDEGLSDNPYGLLGQFKDLRVRIQENTGTVTRGNKVKKTGTMTFPQFINRKSVRVFEGQRLNMASKQHTKCWYVRNNGRGLLEGKVQNYRAPNLLHDHLASGLARRFTI